MTAPMSPATPPAMSLQDDRGLLLGDGLFETLLAIDGQVRCLDAHLDRMAAGCATLGLPALDREAAARLCRAAPGEAGLERDRVAVRLTLTAGSGGRGLERPAALAPRLMARAAAAPAVETPAVLVLAKVRRNEGSPAARLKTLSYLDNVLARAEALAAGADEAVMLNNRGELACAAAANLFWITGDRLFTPALSCGVLNGIMRARVLAKAAELGVETVVTAAGPPALDGADAAFLTNSLMGVRPVARFAARTFADHALIQRLRAAL